MRIDIVSIENINRSLSITDHNKTMTVQRVVSITRFETGEFILKVYASRAQEGNLNLEPILTVSVDRSSVYFIDPSGIVVWTKPISGLSIFVRATHSQGFPETFAGQGPRFLGFRLLISLWFLCT